MRTLVDENPTEKKEAAMKTRTSSKSLSKNETEQETDAAGTESNGGATETAHHANGTTNGADLPQEASAPASDLLAVEETSPVSDGDSAGTGTEADDIAAAPTVAARARRTDLTEAAYDDMPYPGGSYRNTHPSHLAMVAKMCGITPTPPRRCRVLEIGCSMGANLIPMAHDLPDSQFVGIDLSARQVKEGQEFIEELGLKNIELRHLSVDEMDDSFGKFDYVICHGVYSWVSREVQRAILENGRKHLSRNGIFYVSYNVYPGWHLRGVVREMMLYHTASFETRKQRVAQARGLLDFLVKHAKSRSQAYSSLLKEEAQMLENRLDSYIAHEHLEIHNEPVYFHEFAKRAAEAGLRYMADAAIGSMVAQLFDESTAEILKDVPLLRREQYMDFLRSRMFRCSLLCHPDLMPNYRMPSNNLLDLHVALSQPLVASEGEKPGDTVWQHPTGKVTTQMPITPAIETLNRAFPGWVAVQDIIDAVPENMEKDPVLDALMMGFIRGLLQLAKDPVTIYTEVSEKPKVSPLSLAQAKKGNKISNRLHTDYIFQPQQRLMIEAMDGTRTAEDLAELLRAAVRDGRLKVSKEGAELNSETLDALEIVRAELQRLRAMAMYVG
jgi:methyltransferase-like protein/cyclopropane fatty-acyl-phospholipid synthase-like methyltransferase